MKLYRKKRGGSIRGTSFPKPEEKTEQEQAFENKAGKLIKEYLDIKKAYGGNTLEDIKKDFKKEEREFLNDIGSDDDEFEDVDKYDAEEKGLLNDWQILNNKKEDIEKWDELKKEINNMKYKKSMKMDEFIKQYQIKYGGKRKTRKKRRRKNKRKTKRRKTKRKKRKRKRKTKRRR